MLQQACAGSVARLALRTYRSPRRARSTSLCTRWRGKSVVG